MGSTGILVVDDGAGDHVQVHDVRVVPGLGQLVYLDKIIHMTIAQEWVVAKVKLRNFV